MIPREAIEAFLGKAEVTSRGAILNMEAALSAAFAAMSEPVVHVRPCRVSPISGDEYDSFTLSSPDHPKAFPLYAAPQHSAVTAHTFQIGDSVRKRSGSWWKGRVVGFYSTDQIPDGVCVQLDKPMGPVQIYPASALEGGGE